MKQILVLSFTAFVGLNFCGCAEFRLPELPQFPTFGGNTSSKTEVDWTSKNLKNCRVKPTVYCVSHFDYEPLGRNHKELAQQIHDICWAVDMRVMKEGNTEELKKIRWNIGKGKYGLDEQTNFDNNCRLASNIVGINDRNTKNKIDEFNSIY
ncbi:hypothetical protein OFO07_06280 [Campylobacter sp. JMF_06 NA1]|uniref:hypothetical protein n=1 Tax=Campylobacter sp. JMF_06 NA1 TaxID=2983823 RepID=UPI0022E9CE41|nr:hypothetical protein [Campylobacter sp. JMF_06 NA1]MDA3078523.1 hypothetical protein [Campylobacter sp. JMF_06 NA1]